MENRVVVRPVASGWSVESPEGTTVLSMKTDAEKLGRRLAKALPGRKMLLILRQDGSLASAVSYGADRPPVTSFLHTAVKAFPL
jgi:hypothetical protein